MVYQEERCTTWLWPLSRAPSLKDNHIAENDADDEKRAFDMADCAEKGLAREIVTDFMHPLRRSSRLWKFHIVRSDDKRQYRLSSDAGEFLMYARAQLPIRRFELFAYNPSDTEFVCYDLSRPAFSMTFSKDRTEWRLIQEKCEKCSFSPKHLTCDSFGKQQVAFARHSKTPVGDGMFNSMEVHIPGLYNDGRRVAWCPLRAKCDLSCPPDDSHEALRLITKQPSWSSVAESLVLDFKGRTIESSARNFQLALEQKPDHVICQFGKVGTNTFALDLRYPMSIVQAFGLALSTLFWT